MKIDSSIIEKLKIELKKPLPGEDAQYRMAPGYRPKMSKEQIQSYTPRLGGVLLLMYERRGELQIVFTQRMEYNGVHSGQMSFPGGKKDESDADMVQTALRETKEEIGIEASQVELIGKLSELYIPPSNFLVFPSVGYAASIDTFVPQVNEVARIVEIPVGFFLDKQNIDLQKEIKLYNNTTVRVPAYIFNEYIIWGATAIMLAEFTFILENALKN